MGSSFSGFWGSNDNVIDPATNLSGKQKRLVSNTWNNHFKKDATATGVAIMTAYFRRHPDYQQFFESFKDVPLEELPDNHKFQAHCLNVVTALGIAIDLINNPPLLEASLTKLGERHRKRGQSREQFDHLKVVMLEVMSDSLGPKFTPEVRDAWSRTLDTTFEVICKDFS